MEFIAGLAGIIVFIIVVRIYNDIRTTAPAQTTYTAQATVQTEDTQDSAKES